MDIPTNGEDKFWLDGHLHTRSYKVGCQWPKVHLSTLCLTQRQPDIFRIYHCHGVLTNYEPTAMDHLGWLEFPTGSGTRTHPGCPTATGQATGCQGPKRIGWHGDQL